MDFYRPRKLMFKAWNKEAKLLMRLSNIDCRRGELFKKDHIILQFTGLYDSKDEEIYEMDVLLITNQKFIVMWDESANGWMLVKLKDKSGAQPFVKEIAIKGQRLWSYFESDEKDSLIQ
ncbi:MAG TPA: YopX family protein [Chryseosolibacter sp.]